MLCRLATWPITTVEITCHAGDEDDHTTTGRLTCLFHIGSRLIESFVQTVVGGFVVRRNVTQSKIHGPSITSELLQQLSVVVVSHDCNFVRWFQTSQRLRCCMTNLIAKRIQTPTSVD